LFNKAIALFLKCQTLTSTIKRHSHIPPLRSLAPPIANSLQATLVSVKNWIVNPLRLHSMQQAPKEKSQAKQPLSLFKTLLPHGELIPLPSLSILRATCRQLHKCRVKRKDLSPSQLEKFCRTKSSWSQIQLSLA